jgi:hypothetical protein
LRGEREVTVAVIDVDAATIVKSSWPRIACIAFSQVTQAPTRRALRFTFYALPKIVVSPHREGDVIEPSTATATVPRLS